jgi:hypothetical protein
MIVGLGYRTASHGVRNRPHDLLGRLVLPLPLIGDLPQEVVLGPGEVGHFHDQLGLERRCATGF